MLGRTKVSVAEIKPDGGKFWVPLRYSQSIGSLLFEAPTANRPTQSCLPPSLPETLTVTLPPGAAEDGVAETVAELLDGGDAEHCAVVPPFDPAQLQLHGPEPLTAEAVPALQRLVVGVVEVVSPFAEPQEPLTSAALVTVIVLLDAPSA